jgi:cell division protein ZapA
LGRVTLQLNGKGFVLGCEDGEEAKLLALGARVEAKLRQIGPDAGAPGDARLMLMAALMLADDLESAEKARAEALLRADQVGATLKGIEAKVSVALDAIADRLETMAPESTAGQLQLL